MPRKRPILYVAVGLGALALAGTASAVPVTLDFDPGGGGVADSGFTGTQTGTPAADLSKLALAAGHLNVTSTAGLGPSQVNALQVAPGVVGQSYYAEANIDNPALTTPFQEEGIWVGLDQARNVKLTLQQGPTGPRIELYRSGDDPTLAIHRSLTTLTGVTSIRLTLQVNTIANVVVGKYNVFGAGQSGNTQSAGYLSLAGMGTAADRVGVQTSNFGALTPITASYADFGTGTIGIDVTPPTLSSATPGPGATGVPTTTALTANFSETMDPTAVAGGFTLSGPAGAVPASIDSVAGSSAKSFVLTPLALAPGTTYTVGLSGNVRDQYGNPLAPQSWAFTTAGGAPAGGGGAAPGGGAAAGGSAPGGATAPVIASISTPKTQSALKVSLSATRKVKRGGKASLTLRFTRVPATVVTVSRKQGTAFKSVLKQKAAKTLTVLKVPVGTKTGKVQFRVAYKDGSVNRTSLFSVTVTR